MADQGERPWPARRLRRADEPAADEYHRPRPSTPPEPAAAPPPAPGSRRARRLAEAAQAAQAQTTQTWQAAQAAQAAQAQTTQTTQTWQATQAAQAAQAQTTQTTQTTPAWQGTPDPPAASPSPTRFLTVPTAIAPELAPSLGEAGRDARHEPEPGRRAPRRRGPALPLISALLLAWSLTCLIEVDRPRALVAVLAAAASASPVVAVCAVAIAAFALPARRWFTGGVVIMAGLLPWTFAVPYAIPATLPAGRTTPVRVLVVNAHEGRADPKDIAATVRNQSVDLLVVTELTNRLAHDLTTNGIDGRLVARWVSVPPFTASGTAAQAGLGIWSRFTMKDFTPVPGTHWPAVRSTLETGHARLTVVAGHVAPPTLVSAGSWSADLAALHRAGEVPGAVTILGGLNGTPWNPQFRTTATGGLHDAGDVLGRGVRPTWPSWLGIPLLPLDHALVGGRVGVQSLFGATIDGTDHRALLVTLLVPDDSP